MDAPGLQENAEESRTLFFFIHVLVPTGAIGPFYRAGTGKLLVHHG